MIELLIVVAILSMLLSILAPSLKRARLHAMMAVCQSNLLAIGHGLIAYTNDSGHYPGGHTRSGSVCVVWNARLRVYTGGDTEIFWCPVARSESKWTVRYGSGLPAAYGYRADEVRIVPSDYFSYGYNNWGSADFLDPQVGLGGLVDYYPDDSNPDWNELPARRVRVPSRMIAIGDSSIDHSWDAFIDPELGEVLEWPDGRHFGCAGILFCDGHVRHIPLDELVGNTADITPRWNADHQHHVR